VIGVDNSFSDFGVGGGSAGMADGTTIRLVFLEYFGAGVGAEAGAGAAGAEAEAGGGNSVSPVGPVLCFLTIIVRGIWICWIIIIENYYNQFLSNDLLIE